MIPDFDPARPGKAIYDLGPIVGPLEGVSDDILCCINNGEGPSVLLCGGIHGDEYEAQVVLRQLITRLEATAVSGRIFIVPSLNFPAAQKGKRLSPLDGQNMNRVFPGRSDRNAHRTARRFPDRHAVPAGRPPDRRPRRRPRCLRSADGLRVHDADKCGERGEADRADGGLGLSIYPARHGHSGDRMRSGGGR